MRKHIRAMALLFVFALAAAAQSPARGWIEVKALTPGTSVRVSMGSRTLTGQVQSVTDDSLTVDSGKGQDVLARADVKRVSVKTKGHRGRNALIGLGVGAGVGAAALAASDKPCTGFCVFSISRGEAAGLGAVVFGVIGAAAGALIPTGGWRETYKQ